MGGMTGAQCGTVRRVLVIDDHADAADMLALLLRRRGHEAEVAYDVPSALEVFERFHPDVALVDIGLPSMSGHQLATELDRRARGHLLLVAVSGRPPDADAFETSFAHYLVKPVTMKSLMAILANAPAAP